ncbi:MAG: hypothetical protein FJW98_04160 [Actinobacteria bacterium]|nr:hypothetical protein [Actinomycetota bacterium]
MSQPSDSFPSDSLPNDPSWSPDQQSIQHQVRHCEPITRDLNRHLTDLLGRCPVTTDGRWVQLVESHSYADGEVVFPALPVKEALRLATALQTISIEVSLSDVRGVIPAPGVYHPSALALAPTTGPSRFHISRRIEGFRADS